MATAYPELVEGKTRSFLSIRDELEQLFQLRNQGRQVVLNGVPHQFFVNFEVDMHNPMPHGAHKIPRNRRMFFLNLFGNLIRGLADNDEIHFHRPDGFLVFAERFIVHAAREFLDFGNRVQDIADTVPPIPRRHGSSPPSHAHEYMASGYRESQDQQDNRVTFRGNPVGQISQSSQQDGRIQPANPHRSWMSLHHVQPIQIATKILRRIALPTQHFENNTPSHIKYYTSISAQKGLYLRFLPKNMLPSRVNSVLGS